MKFKVFSVVVGTDACMAKCPFCVSREDVCKEKLEYSAVNWRNFKIGCRLATRSGIDTVMLTSRGEPMLFSDQITSYLMHLNKYEFPFVELQTNALVLGKHFEKYKELLATWYELGLTTICISVVSSEKEKNRVNYTPDGDYMNIEELVDNLHKMGFSVRITCVMCKGITSTVEDVEKFIRWAKSMKVEQTTLRPLNEEFRRKETQDWISTRLLTEEDKEEIRSYLDKNGTVLLNLTKLGTVYDVYGQNVMLSVPLNANIRTADEESGRQLIFFPDGHIRYEWEKEGGILL